jgi:pyruvyltransferase
MSGDSRRPIPVNYFIRIPNVGDRVNPLLVQSVSGRWVRHSASPSLSHLLAIGSMMAVANPMSHVWGTGVMHPDIGIGTAAAEHIYALRGKLSHSALRQGGVSVGDVPLGDPGYLAPAMLGISRAPMPQYKVGLVCHYVDRCNPTLRAMMEEDGVADLNVHDLPEVFLSRMAQCDTVISSSLHGLVFAEALGIPNLWIKAGNEIAGDDFKFRDWFSTTRQPGTLPHLLTANDTPRKHHRHDCPRRCLPA